MDRERACLRVSHFLARRISGGLPPELLEELAREASLRYGLPLRDALALARALAELRAEFPGKSPSWFARAATRVLLGVRKVREGCWLVRGSALLGDSYPVYAVSFHPEERRYYCTCASHFGGDRRKIGICTHVAAVMVYRRLARSLAEFT